MKSFVTLVRTWWEAAKKYIWIAVVVYVIHLSIEGFIVNMLYYQVLKPAYFAFV